MWISNRKHAYKIIKQYKNGEVKLQGKYCVFFTTQPKLEANGYRVVKQKPSFV